jgi:hypothetical protein
VFTGVIVEWAEGNPTMESAKLTASAPEADWRKTQRFQEVYLEYMQTLHGLISSSAVQEKLAESYGEYGRVLQSAISAEDVQRRAAEAYGKYMETLQDALAQSSNRHRTAEAFRRYVAATRQAWLDLQAESLDPTLLVGIAQSMMSAAAVAAGSAAITAAQAKPSAGGESST